jgi:LAO/AO transport system kinase
MHSAASSSQTAADTKALQLIEGVRSQNRTLLAQAITIIESNAPRHRPVAERILEALVPHSGQAVRVGITGVPGVGKSSFIEAFGLHLCETCQKKVAVLAVDPSSPVSRGSILGDKTRMEHLSRHPSCFIRPSPSGGTLGGVARKSRETMLLCEAFGFDVILVETVGVGQSETTVRSMVDFFLFLALTGAGDELQGIKKGIMELADTILVTKADGDNALRAQATRVEFERILHYLAPSTHGWSPKALSCSALTNTGIPEVWAAIEEFVDATHRAGAWEERRHRQAVDWVRAMIEERLLSAFLENPDVSNQWPKIERAVRDLRLPPGQAADRLLAAFKYP